MTVEQMRTEVSKAYSSSSWKKKVSAMPDGQILALYFKFLSDGKFSGAKSEKKPVICKKATENISDQMSLFDNFV